MPPVCLHLGIAEEAIERLKHPVALQNQGSFLLGSTAPDMRIITAATREETHFFDLVCDTYGSSIGGFFEEYPHLREVAKLNSPTKAFVCGYLSHLVTDEVWICEVYRPFFGEGSTLAGDPLANVLDRALQFELDRRERADQRKVQEFQALLADSDSGVDVGFIDAATLRQWREFVSTAVGREPSWDRFPIFAQRFLIAEQKVDKEPLEVFLASVRSKLEDILDRVGTQQLEAFREKSIADSVRVAGEYLG